MSFMQGMLDTLKNPYVRYGLLVTVSVTVGATVYHFYAKRTRSGVSCELKKMLNGGRKSLKKAFLKKDGESGCAKDLREMGKALSELKFEKGLLRRTVNECVDAIFALLNHCNGEVPLTDAKLKAMIKKFDISSKKLVENKSWKEKDGDVDEDEKDTAEAA